MNKMAELAKLLGVELDEEFIIQSPDGYKCKCKLTNEGLLDYTPASAEWELRNGYLYDLIAGKYEIANLPWKAKNHEKYFVPLLRGETYDKFYFTADSVDDIIYQRGLMCKTPKQAKKLSKLLIKTARQFQGFDEEQENE